ncbi:MAG: AAA family ATPase [Cyclobacteriaceae bacterium]
MTQFNPYLKLSRLVIFTKEGEISYDEAFHAGVNIIRGHNSSGKSTISNFIFYVLGGDFKKWTTAAQSCGDVYAELEINSEMVTVKRTVSPNVRQPMSIFWGSYEESNANGSIGWEIYPFSRNEKSNRKSFSNSLFLALGLPELRGDMDSNITMHQILRLLYVDQKSLTLDLLMTESFDSSITRKTISDLLFGVYDDTLYSDEISLREAEKEQEIKKKQFEGIERILKSSDTETDPLVINNQIDDNTKETASIESYLETLRNEQNLENQKSEEDQLKILEIKTVLLQNRNELTKLQSEINEYEFEISDSNEFIRSLEKRAIALKNSLTTRESFSEIQITHCPNCLSPLDAPVDKEHCHLCKQQLPEDKGSSQIKRMQQEVDNQLRESRKLLQNKEHLLLELKSKFPAIEQTVRQLQRDLNDSLRTVRSSRDERYDELLVKTGELRSENDHLVKQLRAIEQIDVLRKELAILATKIESLRISISSKRQDQNRKLQSSFEDIRNQSLRLLHSDLGRQPEFSTGSNVKIDFEKNTFSLDGENNFSESSNVYLKNSVRFGVFFTSLNMEFFRLPRFVLCDNIEDKGMEPVRSQSFQKEVVSMSNESDVEHQIIITTSMIAPELDNTDMCVGEFYTETQKTLKNID